MSRDPGGVVGKEKNLESNDILYDSSGAAERTCVFGVNLKDIFRINIVVLVVSFMWVRYYGARRFC